MCMLFSACSYQSNPYTDSGKPENTFVYYSTLVDSARFLPIELLSLEDSAITVHFPEDTLTPLAISINTIHAIRVVVLTQKNRKPNSYIFAGRPMSSGPNTIGISTEIHHNTGGSNHDFGLPAIAGTSSESYQGKPNTKLKARMYKLKGRVDAYLQLRTELASYVKKI